MSLSCECRIRESRAWEREVANVFPACVHVVGAHLSACGFNAILYDRGSCAVCKLKSSKKEHVS